MAIALRLFIAKQANIESWSNDGKKILAYLKDTDFVYLIKDSSDEELSTEKKFIINELKGKNKLDEIFTSDIAEIFTEVNQRNRNNHRTTEDTNYYFVQCPEIYDYYQDKKDLIQEKFKDFYNSDTYRVGKKGPKNKSHDNSNLLGFLASSIGKNSSSKEEKKEVEDSINLNNDENTSLVNYSAQENKTEVTPDEGKVEKKDASKLEEQLKRKEEEQRVLKEKLKNNKKVDVNKQEESYNYKEIEDKIFGQEYKINKIEYKYSEIDDAKAKLIYLVSERFNQHLFVLFPEIKDFNLDDDQLALINNLFARANDSKSFLELWKAKFPTKILKIDNNFEGNYSRIKKEADFYLELSTFLYFKDVF